ncbi:hypothetical protein [Cetobacterium sp. SF1]|uniref:hypothetical protein n=1 Tax=unclassified Cetobacterium TaxID=2630983 RepID=UPI003CEA3FFF
MKKLFIFSLLLSTAAFASQYRDGVYRGTFVSGQETQVEVQFKLKNDVVENTRFRTLYYKGEDYLKNKDLEREKNTYTAALKATEGKNVDEAKEMLYSPEKIEMAGASVRASKIRAAMQNAINSGVYKPDQK